MRELNNIEYEWLDLKNYFSSLHPQVGKIYKSGGEVFIKEAGEVDCIRGEDPLISGMKITKQGEVLRLRCCVTFSDVVFFPIPQPLVLEDRQFRYIPLPHRRQKLNLPCLGGITTEAQRRLVK